ncbi:L,D-transpeptidase family protein [Sphingomonas sp. M1-B02]|uniref:L,D-transpeptidase family protein n=1 Tax=Sphingomonas sp. M1-B02 TaxID=3114300 RepID=UPI00223EEAFC|nr:L,D-transpeptidase family protein [Sphingomonas sp. S6-11]UZK66593.1 L,D-transpeptidase family protein [Sphingomonas sp. S6-11]
MISRATKGRTIGWSTALATIAGVLSAPGLAQQAPPSTTPQAAPMVQPIQSVALPVLNPAQAAQLSQLIAESGFAQGLRHGATAAPRPQDNDAIVRAALDYARAVHSGRLDSSDFQADWGLRPMAYDPLPAFADAVKRDRVAAWIRSLPPPYSGYDALQKGLVAYRAIETAGGWKAIPAGPDMGVGASGARVLALRQRLAVEDRDVVATGSKFDAELKEAVVRAQRRYGLNPTGLVSTGTLAALNVPAADRVRQIMANMERWRWLPAELPAKRIQVNIAAAVLTVFEGDAPIASMKAVTGRPGNETPMLQSRIHSVVLNPPWNVPTSIATKELWPKGAAALARQGYKIIGTGPGRRLQQQPGPKSALGLYKFDFDNPYAVYLHDTPSQSTFASFSRLASHGCVRFEKPGPLARLLLRNDPAWQPEQIDTALAKGKTLRVSLQPQDQVQVYLLYWTAFASANGEMSFRADPYGWDKTLAAKIEKRSALTAVAAR